MPKAPTGPEIALRAQQLKIVYLALMATLPSILDPSLPILHTELARLGEPPNGDFPACLYYDEADGGEALTFSTREVLTKAANLRGDILREDLMSIGMMLGATGLGDMITEGGHSKKDVPLLQFARHFRNACAHGDRWHFERGEPKTPATCRHLTLTPALQGKRATWEVVTPRLYPEYLDDITNYFLPGSISAPAPR